MAPYMGRVTGIRCIGVCCIGRNKEPISFIGSKTSHLLITQTAFHRWHMTPLLLSRAQAERRREYGPCFLGKRSSTVFLYVAVEQLKYYCQWRYEYFNGPVWADALVLQVKIYSIANPAMSSLPLKFIQVCTLFEMTTYSGSLLEALPITPDEMIRAKFAILRNLDLFYNQKKHAV